MKNNIFFVFVFLVPLLGFCQIDNEDNFYKAPTSFKVVKNLQTDFNVDNSFETDDSEKLQKEINFISKKGGNYASVSDADTIVKILALLKERQDIKNIIIDDWQYILAEEFMAKALKKGYDKFNEIAKHGYDTINAGKTLRPDQNFICIAHSDYDDKAGTYKLKTIGKMLDDKINLAGLFTVVLYTQVDAVNKDGKIEVTYNFVTNKLINNTGIEIPAKSPIGMFDNLLIPNDLGLVLQKANEYYG